MQNPFLVSIRKLTENEKFRSEVYGTNLVLILKKNFKNSLMNPDLLHHLPVWFEVRTKLISAVVKHNTLIQIGDGFTLSKFKSDLI